MTIVVTYAYNHYTGCFVVEDWARAFDALKKLTVLDKTSWIRVQVVPVF